MYTVHFGGLKMHQVIILENQQHADSFCDPLYFNLMALLRCINCFGLAGNIHCVHINKSILIAGVVSNINGRNIFFPVREINFQPSEFVRRVEEISHFWLTNEMFLSDGFIRNILKTVCWSLRHKIAKQLREEYGLKIIDKEAFNQEPAY